MLRDEAVAYFYIMRGDHYIIWTKIKRPGTIMHRYRNLLFS